MDLDKGCQERHSSSVERNREEVMQATPAWREMREGETGETSSWTGE